MIYPDIYELEHVLFVKNKIFTEKYEFNYPVLDFNKMFGVTGCW